MRLWVDNWKRVGPELEKIKRAELRAMTDEEAAARAIRVMNARVSDRWINPKRCSSSGLIEQQRLFTKDIGTTQ